VACGLLRLRLRYIAVGAAEAREAGCVRYEVASIDRPYPRWLSGKEDVKEHARVVAWYLAFRKGMFELGQRAIAKHHLQHALARK
jgi:hypothetical protein